MASNGTYTVSPMLVRPTKACGVVIPRRVFCLAIEPSEPHESCSWEMI
ncbi:conserved hypothetical protein [Burkholderia vietnamiensis]|nr:hypothetical protein MYA_0839 [Burkholderia sp. KJ006]CAG9189419.1 conserved hypothetical protein [Burkholderia vietnamiensis]CAG9234547.1 conserved hypothetical protein [Burkholderia vietnamiensis]